MQQAGKEDRRPGVAVGSAKPRPALREPVMQVQAMVPVVAVLYRRALATQEVLGPPV